MTNAEERAWHPRLRARVLETRVDLFLWRVAISIAKNIFLPQTGKTGKITGKTEPKPDKTF